MFGVEENWPLVDDFEVNLVRMSARKSMLNHFWGTLPGVLRTSSPSSPLIPVLAGIVACAYAFPTSRAWAWWGVGEGKEMVLHFLTWCYFWLLLEESSFLELKWMSRQETCRTLEVRYYVQWDLFWICLNLVEECIGSQKHIKGDSFDSASY